jgi:hypothetical protein
MAATLLMSGCTTRVDLGTKTRAPSVTMNYTGVRAGTRRFPDYGIVDRKILAGKR